MTKSEEIGSLSRQLKALAWGEGGVKVIPPKVPASDFIKRVCCGYSSRLGGHHYIVALEGYVEDSGSSPDRNVFVLAGYISTANQWSSFSNEWELICDQEPKSPDFKMTKAFGPQYKWTPEQRDKRIADLASLVSQKAEYRIDAKASRENNLTNYSGCGLTRVCLSPPQFARSHHDTVRLPR